MNKAISVGVGVGIAIIIIAVVGIYAIPTTKQSPVPHEFALKDEVEIKIDRATEEIQEPTSSTAYNFTVEESFVLQGP